MARRLHIVKDDTQAQLTVALTERANNAPIDVSGAAIVRMYTRQDNTTTVLDTIEATKLPGRVLDDTTLDTTVTTPGQGGRVQFDLPPAFTGRDPGLYEGEIEITFESGLIKTVYEVVKFSIRADF